MRTAVVWLPILAVLFLGAKVGAQPHYDQLRLIAPAAPGGGWDQTARAMQQALQTAGLATIAPVENIPGAAGTIGLARFMGAERGNADAVMISGLIMLGGIITHRSPVTLGDVVPIARLTGEYEVIAVPSSSPIRSFRDLVDAFVARPESISWGGGSAGGSDQILAGLIADQLGVAPRRINYIAFSGGGESLAAVLGGQVSVGINGLAELAPQIEAGTLRALAISSAARLPGLDVPTLREQGVDVEFENWRSVMAPPGVSPEARHRLEATIAAMVASPPWRAILDRYRWLDRHLEGAAFEQFLSAEETRVRKVLRQLGTADEPTSGLSSAGPYPLFVLAGLLVCGLGAARETLTRRVAAGGSHLPGRPSTSVASLALVSSGAALYLGLAERAGFIAASIALCWLTARAFDARRPWRDLGFAVAVSVSFYVLFARVLQVSLPAGVFAGWI